LKPNLEAGAGFIIEVRDYTGMVLLAGAYRLGDMPLVVVKATTIRNGVHKVIQCRYKNVILERDNQVLKQAVQMK